MPIRTFQFRGQAAITASTSTTFNRTVTDTLALVDDGFPGFRRSAGDTLELVDQAASYQLAGGVSAFSQAIALAQAVHVFGYEVVEDDLGALLSDEAVAQYPTALSTFQVIPFFQSVAVKQAVQNVSAESDLSATLSDRAAIAQTFSLTTNLNLVDEGTRFWFRITDDLNLVEEAKGGKGLYASNDIDLVDGDPLVIQKLNKSLSDDNIVTQACSWYVESPCAKMQFKTFHGEGGVEPASALLNYDSDFLLQSMEDGTIVRLRNPELDDRRRVSFNRANRQFFDNSFDIYADDSWVTEQVQIYTIISTKREDVDSLATFLDNNLGIEVVLKDWRGVTWMVIITNPGEVYTEDAEGYWTLDFEVTGTRFGGEWVGEFPSLQQEPSRAGSIYRRIGTTSSVVTDIAGRNYEQDELTSPIGVTDVASAVIE